jgi:hypothetical protein
MVISAITWQTESVGMRRLAAIRQGVDPPVVLELLRCWNVLHCRPPLSDKELERTVDSIARMHLRRDQQIDV